MELQPQKRKKHKYSGVHPQQEPGKYRVNWYDWSGVRKTKIIHGTEEDAARFRRMKMVESDQIKHGLKPIPRTQNTMITLKDLWDQFQADYRLKIKSGSIKQVSLDRYRNTIDALLSFNPAFITQRIDSLTWKDFEKFKIHRNENGYSPAGTNTSIRNLRTIFRYAVANGFLKESPINKVDFIKIHQEDARYLNEDELKSLYRSLDALDLKDPFQKDAYDLVYFYLYTGARTSEILYPDFTWMCIGQRKIYFPRTKNYKARTIPITDTIQTILENRKSISGGPFFVTTDQNNCHGEKLEETHITRDMVYNRTKFVFEKAGLDDISTHNLRKTAGAIYYVATRDIFATSCFLGHSSVKVTESHYVGLIQSLKKEYSIKFDDKLSEMLVRDVPNVYYECTI